MFYFLIVGVMSLANNTVVGIVAGAIIMVFGLVEIGISLVYLEPGLPVPDGGLAPQSVRSSGSGL